MARTELYLIVERGLEGGVGRPRLVVVKYPADPPDGNVLKMVSGRQLGRYLERRRAALERYGKDGEPILVSLRRSLGI